MFAKKSTTDKEKRDMIHKNLLIGSATLGIISFCFAIYLNALRIKKMK